MFEDFAKLFAIQRKRPFVDVQEEAIGREPQGVFAA
jgi:hypothetical protein